MKKEEEKEQKETEEKARKQQPQAAPSQSNGSVYYKNCSEVKAVGKAPLHAGDPGYSYKLDKDRDGIACEK